MSGWYTAVLVLLVPSIIHAQTQCPTDRTVQRVSCGRSRGSMQCPTNSRCIGTVCCLDEQSSVSSPCNDPMTRGGELVTCDLPGQRGGRRCPGSCHSCRDLTGVGMGLCCPETQRRGCENASPAEVEFRRAVQRIRGQTRTGSSSTSGNFDRSSMSGSDFRSGTGTLRGDSGRSFTRSDPRNISPRLNTLRPSGPCGVGMRSFGRCDRRDRFLPLCPRGFYCAPDGFEGVCCPLRSSSARRRFIDLRRDPMGLPRSAERFPIRRRTGTMSRDITRVDGSGQFRPTLDRASRAGTSSRGLGGGTSVSDIDRRLFGPPPDENFPGGPNDPRNRHRGRCPTSLPCNRRAMNECYSDSDCPQPLRCCLAGDGCARVCASAS